MNTALLLKKHRKTRVSREAEMIQRLLQFRFLTTNHIQRLLNHETKDKPAKWLRNLLKQHYIYQFYTPDLRNIPAVYCLDTASIPHLREKGIDEVLLKRIYTEKTRTIHFRNHCLLVAH